MAESVKSAFDTPEDDELFENFIVPDEFAERARRRRPEPEVIERIVEVLPGNALLYQADGSIVHDRFSITPTGLILPDDLTDEEWEGIGRVIKTIESAGMWAAGDWAAHANKKWGVSYEEIATRFDYHPDTLKVYASVCRNVPTLIRNQRLPFSHHRVVAKLRPGEQEKALEKGFDGNGNSLSLDDFKAALRGNRLRAPVSSGAVAEWDKHYQRFAKSQLPVAKKAKPHERKQMADMLRSLAEIIEAMQ